MVGELALSTVAERCADESERYRTQQESDSRYCFELFRRAIVERIDAAWTLLFEQYERLVMKWIYDHPAFATSGESADYFLTLAFERFWQAVTPTKFSEKFATLGAVLQYLKLCVGGALIDHARSQQRAGKAQPLDQVSHFLPSQFNLEKAISDRSARQSLWQQVVSQAKNDQERIVMEEAFLYDMAAADIAQRHPDLFDNVKQVYRVKENLLKRLRRSLAE